MCFQNILGSLGLTCVKPDELYCFVVFLCIKQSPHLSQLLRRKLLYCFAMKLQKLFCGLQCFTWPSISMELGKWWLKFSFLGEFILWNTNLCFFRWGNSGNFRFFKKKGLLKQHYVEIGILWYLAPPTVSDVNRNPRSITVYVSRHASYKQNSLNSVLIIYAVPRHLSYLVLEEKSFAYIRQKLHNVALTDVSSLLNLTQYFFNTVFIQ